MAEPKIELPDVIEVPVNKTSRLKSFTVNHPRTAKVVGFTALACVVVGVVSAVQNRRQVVESTDDDASVVPFEAPSKTA